MRTRSPSTGIRTLIAFHAGFAYARPQGNGGVVDRAAELTAVVEKIESSLRAAVESAGVSAARESTVGEWAAALEGLARLVATAQAAEDLAITRLAAIETEVAEDGTLVERHRAAGHVSVDAGAVVAGALSSLSKRGSEVARC